MTVYAAGGQLTAASLTEATEMLKGGVLRSTAAAATSGTTELAIATSGLITLLANTTYELSAEYFWTNSVANDVFFFRLRDTNISGTILNGIVGFPGGGGGPYSTSVSYTFETTAGSSKVYLATIVRGVGTGTATVQPSSRLSVKRIGPSGIYTIV